MHVLFAIYAFVLGAVIGSFLNVVIHRWPLEQSLVRPASHCPQCGASIRWYHNVPVLSWMLLGGRCRDCRNPISIRYPLVELATALFYLALYLRTGVTLGFLPVAAVVAMLITLIFIDLDVQLLPDVIDLPGIAVGLGIGWMGLGVLYPDLVLSHSLPDSLLGAVLGGGVLLVVGAAYKLIRRVEGMGMGDVKMLAMIGAVVGWEPLIPLLFAASFAGATFGVGLGLVRKEGLQAAVPFGVFLGLAGFFVIFFGHTLAGWYLGLLHY